MKKLYITILLSGLVMPLWSQVEVETASFDIRRSEDFRPRDSEPGFNARVYSLEAPDAMSWRAQLNEVKRKAHERFSNADPVPYESRKRTAPQPIHSWSTEMYQYYSTIGIRAALYPGIPNDNTLAYSKGGILLGAVNTFIWAYDLNNDTLFMNNSYADLDIVGPSDFNDRGFDPKLLYDAEMDRFILVFLKNNTPNNSKIAVCFSSTNDPNDPWYTYILPGNPLNNDRWTDFPAISTDGDHLYITGNLIIPNVSWQVGFDGSVIWQLDKHAGFAGDSSVANRLHHDIRFGGNYIRNLHPVKGYNGDIDTAYFLSNRNFDMQNDSIFILSLHSGLTGPEDLRIRVRKSNLPYGVPPNGQQADTDPNDPTDGLQTNDARVLGAIRMSNGNIQFVSTTRNFNTNLAAIYHGTIFQPGSSAQITAELISDSVKDFGYPNLAWTGNEECDNEVIIGFNHTSTTDFAGVSAVYYSNDGEYSEVLTLKEGDNYVSRLNGGDRWGDYFGIQHDYAHPGDVYIAGYYGAQNRNNSAYFARLTSPDSSKLELSINHTPTSSKCNQTIELQGSGGIPPYVYYWNGSENTNIQTVCAGDTLQLMVTDTRGCEYSTEYFIPFDIPNEDIIYPNPSAGQVGVAFTAPESGRIVVRLSDMGGKNVWTVTEGTINAGKHYLEYDLTPVPSGVYTLEIIQNDISIFTDRIIKN